MDLTKDGEKMRKIVLLVITLLLLTLAVFAGFSLINTQRGERKPMPVITKVPEPKLNPAGFSQIIYEIDTDSGRIANILAGIISQDKSCFDLIGIDTDISYTMSGELYSELTPANVTLPQTVRMYNLYEYYGSDKAYDAGRQIIGEMLGIRFESSAVFEAGGFDEDLYLKARQCENAEVRYHELPVIRHNENTLPDADAIGNMIFEIIRSDY
ncbi:MAG: hypothetical protein K6G04_00560 [Lachnospiraceae bacterium]|nr:hypothetical protein [Lachnospiraceae bacterium]